MTFAWEAPVDNGGVKLASYKIYVARGSESFEVVVDAASESNPSLTIHTEDQLEPNQTYKFRVAATNIVGEGPMSNEIFVIAADMP
jgi:hypothetical protein